MAPRSTRATSTVQPSTTTNTRGGRTITTRNNNGTRRYWGNTSRRKISNRIDTINCISDDKQRDNSASTSHEQNHHHHHHHAAIMRTFAATTTSRVAACTGVYISLVGLALLIWPSTTFHLVFPHGGIDKPFIRLGGVLCQLFGIYYIGASYGDGSSLSKSEQSMQGGIRAFYMSTILGRMYLAVIIPVLCATCNLSWRAMLLAVLNLAGALSLRRALRE